MKKFKSIKTSAKLENAKLTKEQMYLTSGGLRLACTSGTRSICHIDGTDDADSYFTFA